MNRDIVDKCVAAMAEEDLDGLIAMSPENFAYVAGFIVPAASSVMTRTNAAVARERELRGHATARVAGRASGTGR